MTILDTHAQEESTFVVTVAFEDEDGNAVAPTSANWTLTDEDGTVINNREDVAISSPTSSEDIVLSGDDLAVTETGDAVRVLTVEALYNSALGTGLPLKAEGRFVVDNLVAES